MFWRKLQAGVMAWHPGLLSAPLLTPAPTQDPPLTPWSLLIPPRLSGRATTIQNSAIEPNEVQ